MKRIDLIPSWWDVPEVQKIRQIFRSQPVCFVGGALRDAVANYPSRNFNLYTTLAQEEVLAKLHAAGIETKTRGAFFGEVRALVGKLRFSFATPKNQFSPQEKTQDFLESTRLCVANYDFTINSLFMGLEGHCYDEFGAAEDIREGRVRFIKNPLLSTLDSPERILRFFRLQAWFGKGEPDAMGFAACIANSELLAHIAPETIGSEMRKLFGGPRFAKVFASMDQRDILSEVIGLPYLDRGWLKALEEYEFAHNLPTNSARRLAVLLLSIELPLNNSLMHLAELWRMPPGRQREIQLLLKFLPYVDEKTDPASLGITPQEFAGIMAIRNAIGEDAPAEAYTG